MFTEPCLLVIPGNNYSEVLIVYIITIEMNKPLGNYYQKVGKSLAILSMVTSRFSDALVFLSSETPHPRFFTTLINLIKYIQRDLCGGL